MRRDYELPREYLQNGAVIDFDFEQNETKIACFGKTTAKAVKDAGLRLDIEAPMPEAPSMTMALELYINNMNKNGKK